MARVTREEVWAWSLKPTEGAAEGAEVSFRFQVDVTWTPKDPGVRVKTLTDKFKRIFQMKVGPPASRVNAALYASPVMAFGGLTKIRSRARL